jgi:hypothetical protein
MDLKVQNRMLYKKNMEIKASVIEVETKEFQKNNNFHK